MKLSQIKIWIDKVILLVKLKKLGLVKSSKDTLKALELEKAIALLDKRWDNYFSGN